jgi:hypothetical protein
MALLSERQQKAADLARSLGRMDGVWVVSPLPLADGARLRFQVLDKHKNEVFQTLRDWEWDPQFRGVLPRIHATTFLAATIWEIDFPPERQPVLDDRTIKGEIASREEKKKAAADLAAFRKAIGLKP